jgi:hypothetical protein
VASMQLYADFPYGDPNGLRSFFLENALRHTTYAHLITTRSVFNVPMFDVFDSGMVNDVVAMMAKPQNERKVPFTLQNWLNMHAVLHQAETQIMGLGTNYDIFDADFMDPVAFYDWMQNHALLHDYEDQILGV